MTRYEDARALLSDPRLSVNKATGTPPSLSHGRKSGVMLPKSLIGMDPPEHTPRRQLFMRELTVKQVRRLKPRIEGIVERQLDVVRDLGPPVDLVESFALPVPSLVISELLGVPREDRAEFQDQTVTILRVGSSAEQVQTASSALMEHIRRLVVAKRQEPGEDILSRLAHARIDGELLAEDELVGHGMLLLIAGHETSANMIGLGVGTLLAHPEQLDALKRDPALAEPVVEELLRFHAVIQYGLVRRATADIPIGDTLIKEGDWVVCSLASANRDTACRREPDRLDTTHDSARHVSFGYGFHQCAGQNLARLELQLAFTELFRRFPTLRLERPLEELPFRGDMWVYGLHELPVSW